MEPVIILVIFNYVLHLCYCSPFHRDLLSTGTDFDACEVGNAFEYYDEDCENGATDLLPCNPGQLKISECIGANADTTRICDPCPQKFFQSSYNFCTACHECSECGPNERIKQDCTDESDTVCEKIIPDPTTKPVTRATTPSPSPTQETTTSGIPTTTTTVVPSTTLRKAVSATYALVSPEATTGNKSVKITAEPVSHNDFPSYLIAIILIFPVPWILLLLFIILWWKMKFKYREAKEELRQYKNVQHSSGDMEMTNLYSARPTNDNDGQKDVGSDLTVRMDPPGSSCMCYQERGSEGNQYGQINVRRGVNSEARRAQSERQRTSVIDCPDDDLSDSEDSSRRSRGTLDPDVERDAARSKDRVVIGKEDGDNMKSGDTKLESGDLEPDAKADHIDHQDENGGGGSLPGQPEPEGPRKQQVPEKHHLEMPGVSLRTVEAQVYGSPGHVNKESDLQPCGSKGAPGLPANLPKDIPESSTNPLSNAASVENSKGGSDLGKPGQGVSDHRKTRNHLGKQIQSNGPQLHVAGGADGRPGNGNPHSKPTQPTRTGLQSNIPKGKPTGKQPQEKLLDPVEEVEEDTVHQADHPESLLSAPAANKDRGKEGPGGDCVELRTNQTDTSQQSSLDTSRDTSRKGKQKDSFSLNWKDFVPKMWRRKRERDDSNADLSEPLMSSSLLGEMVSEKFLDDMAQNIHQHTFDKLCRELGEEEKDVKNMKLQYSLEMMSVTERAFKILMDIRAREGRKLKYKLVIDALKNSRNEDVVDGLIKRHLRSES